MIQTALRLSGLLLMGGAALLRAAIVLLGLALARMGYANLTGPVASRAF